MASANEPDKTGRLRQRIGTFRVEPSDLSADESRLFVESARALIARNAPTAIVLLALVQLVWWPTDWIVFADEPRVRAIFMRWRLSIVGILLGGLALGWVTGLLKRHPDVVAGALAVGCLGLTGWLMGGVGSLDGPWMAFLTATPLFVVLLSAPLPLRVLINFGVLLASWGGFVLARPDAVEHPTHLTVLSTFVFTTLLATVIGHLIYMLHRANWTSQHRLEASRAALEAFNTQLAELLDSRTAELRRVLLEAEEVRDRERAWAVREIHDALGAELTGLRYGVALVEQQVSAEVAPRAFEPIHELLRRASETVRRILRGLSWELPDNLELPAALESQLRTMAQRGELEPQFEVSPKPFGDVPLAVRQTLFRVVQEALTNVVRHADATRVSLRICREGEQIALVIEDDGRGIQPGPATGLGMSGIQQRVNEHGGSAEWRAAVPQGTQLRVEIPCPN